jgi:hypothetical protein
MNEDAPDATAAPAFPHDFPCDCPPDNAPLAAGTVYRVVKGNPPAPDDFLTYVEMGKVAPEGRECECCGLSVFTNRDHAEAYSDRYPYLGEHVAVGALDGSHGKLVDTHRTFRGETIEHSTWWPYAGVIRHALFTVP